MDLNNKQSVVKDRITLLSVVMGLDPKLTVAIAMTESSLGLNQKSPTGCKGVFQMSSIAMKDLLQEMVKVDDEIIDIACGLAFIHLLVRRWKTTEEVVAHFCDPKDFDFYLERVNYYMENFNVE